MNGIGKYQKKYFFIVFASLLFLTCNFLPSTANTAGFSSDYLSGTTYVLYAIESGFRGGVPGAWGSMDFVTIIKDTISFHADGSFTVNLSDDELSREIGDDGNKCNTFVTTHFTDADSDSGTYSLDRDGTVTLTEDGETFYGMLSEDGQTIIFGQIVYNDTVMDNGPEGFASFDVAVKKGSSYPTSIPDGMVYESRLLESGFGGRDWGSGDFPGDFGHTDNLFFINDSFTFYSGNTFTSTTSNDDELSREIQDIGAAPCSGNTFVKTFNPIGAPYADSGTYTIYSGGTIEMTFDSDGETISGMISEDYEKVLIGYVFWESGVSSASEAFAGLGMAVRKGSGFSSYFPDNTVYEVRSYETGFRGNGEGPWSVDQLFYIKEIMTFKSDGTFRTRITNDDDLARAIGTDVSGNTFQTTFNPESDIETGTYTIYSGGTIALTYDPGQPYEETDYGVLSADGQAIIFGYTEDEDDEAWVGIGMGVKRIWVPRGALSAIGLLLFGDPPPP